MKHTIKLLTLTFTLVTILTLTGCPGPVTPDKPCTHEHTRTEVIEEATCTEDGLGKVVCVNCEEIIEEQVEIDALGHDFGEWSNWTTTREVAYDHDGEKKHTHTCTRCGHSETEIVTVSRFVAGGYDGDDIPTANEYKYRYQYKEEDDYQIMAYVYSSVEDAKSDNKEVLYFSFPNDTTGIPQIVPINGYLAITIDDLIQMKNEYIGKTVKYFTFQRNWLLQFIDEKWEYQGDPNLLTELENKSLGNNVSPLYIVIE